MHRKRVYFEFMGEYNKHLQLYGMSHDLYRCATVVSLSEQIWETF